MAHSYKILEGGPSHADKLMLGNAADKLGTLSVGTVAAAGDSAATAGVLTNKVIQLVTAADDAVGVILPAGFAGQIMFVANAVAAKYLVVYPPTGGTINGGGANAAYNIPNGQMAISACSAAGVWHLSCELGA